MLGILTLVLLIIVMIPPLRLTWLERTSLRLPRAISLHHVIGISIPFVATCHAISAMRPYLAASVGPAETLSLFVDSSDVMTFSGTLALLCLVLTAIGGAWPRLRRRPWLLLHRLSLIGFALAMGHVALAWTDVWTFRNGFADVLRVLLGALTVAVAAGMATHYVWPEVLATHRVFIVTGVSHPDKGIVELTLQLGKGRGTWRSGEFGYFRFDCQGPCGVTRERHPFTVVKMHGQEQMNVVIKAIGDDTSRLQQIIVGTPGSVSGPYGTFETLLKRRRPQLWIAGGLGMMPFIGLARRMQERDAGAGEVAVVCLVRPGKSSFFWEELQQIAASRPSFKISAVESQAGSEAGIDAIEALVPDWRERDVALAGPHAMVEYWTAILRSHSFPATRIYKEDFTK